jgi:hypothetical protein
MVRRKIEKVPVPTVTNLRLNSKHEIRNPKQIQNSNVQNSKQELPRIKELLQAIVLKMSRRGFVSAICILVI